MILIKIWNNERSEFGEANHEVHLDQDKLNEPKTNIEAHERSE